MAVPSPRIRSKRSFARPAAAACVAERLEDRQLMSTVVALAGRDVLTFVDSAAPDRVLGTVRVRGLAARESLVGIDYRPANGTLYGVGSSSRVYAIDPASGQATVAGAGALNPALSGASYGLDFNPVVDRLRIVSDTDQNLRVNADTGEVADFDADVDGVQSDLALAYATGDANFASNPSVIATAYTNNVAGGTAVPGGFPTTALFGIDDDLDILVRQGSADPTTGSPNNGRLTTIGALGVDTTEAAGLDIETLPGGQTAFASLTTSASPRTRSGLYTINLTTGAATRVGDIGRARRATTDIAVVPTGATLLAVDRNNTLFTVNSALPNVVLSRTKITGLARRDKIIGIDRRPANNTVMALGSEDRVYNINPSTGVATAVGDRTAIDLDRRGLAGVDFNPVVDRLRIVNTAGQNARLNPDTGALVDNDAATPATDIDAPIAYASGDGGVGTTPRLVGAAYTNNVAGATATTLFAIDAARDTLVTVGSAEGATLAVSPNTGQLFTVGSLGIDASDLLGFDIATGSDGTTQTALAATRNGRGLLTLYNVNLTSGVATAIGALGGRRINLIGMTALAPPAQPTPTPTP